MARRSRWLENEEKLALCCSFIVTGVLAAFLQQLKKDNDEGRGLGALVEYQELSVPSTRRRVLIESNRMRSRDQLTTAEVDMNISATVDTARFVQRDGALPVNSTSPRDLGPTDSGATQQSHVFRHYQPDVVLDSIFKADTKARLALLRQHLQYSSSLYDTATTLRLVHLSNAIHRFDERPVTLEESMQRNLRRYGHPYDPTRPQPPSAQVPLGGILSELLHSIF